MGQTDRKHIEYFRSNSITITYEEELQLVRTRWHGFVNSEEYRRILNVYLQLVREKNVTRWIGDNTHAKAIRPADQEWAAKHWVPRFSKEGNLKKMAVVVSEDLFNKMAVENIAKKGGKHLSFDTYFFPSEKEALSWVLAE